LAGSSTGKRSGKKKSSRKKRPAAGATGFLTVEQERDLVGICLLVLALFLYLSLVPTGWFGARGRELFPSGNLVGALGGGAQGLMRALLGKAAFLIPTLLVVGGLRAGDWLDRERSIRLGALFGGLMIILPVAFQIWGTVTGNGGWMGDILGTPLRQGLGWLGASLVVLGAAAALSVGTLGWNPIRTLAGGLAVGGGAARDAAARLAEKSRAAAAAAAAAAEARRAQAEVDESPEWTGPETGEDDEARAEVEAGLWEVPEPEDEPDGELEDATAGALAASRSGGDQDGPADPGMEAEPDPDDLPDPADPRDLEGGALPDVDLLTESDAEDRADMERQLDALGQVLVEKLRTFNVQCELGGRTTGPVVTQFEVVPAPGVKVNRIANLDADLALAMRAPSIRIVAPIPGKGAVGVEIPNPQPELVQLRGILEAREFSRAKGVLPLALGKALTGKPYVADLAKMPHLLIAGATGAGKSVCINTIITSLIYKHTPATLRLLMIDPKMVELSAYGDLPHLRHPVVTDPQDAAGVLKWAVLEMERRYMLLKENGARSIAEFNRKVQDGVTLRRYRPVGAEGHPDRYIYRDGPLPYLVVVVDELADLMMQVQSEVERPLAQLAQKARAIGIHLIVATQRPSVNVITGLIKANFPTRIGFRVASKTDSRTILDMNGAESLLGNGDMLFLPPGQSEPARIQGAFLSTEDTEHLLDWYRSVAEARAEADEEAEAPAQEEVDILEELRTQEMAEAASAAEAITGDWDELFRAAAEVCIQNQGGSTSLLQRRLSIGYGRAARIVDQLQDAGVLGPQDGSKPREVLVSLSELDSLFPGT
jgi:S-DNA-T family DNA segregation ATPase FtsK/SpoIIIE